MKPRCTSYHRIATQRTNLKVGTCWGTMRRSKRGNLECAVSGVTTENACEASVLSPDRRSASSVSLTKEDHGRSQAFSIPLPRSTRRSILKGFDSLAKRANVEPEFCTPRGALSPKVSRECWFKTTSDECQIPSWEGRKLKASGWVSGMNNPPRRCGGGFLSLCRTASFLQ